MNLRLGGADCWKEVKKVVFGYSYTAMLLLTDAVIRIWKEFIMNDLVIIEIA
jgi:hypothetical protein